MAELGFRAAPVRGVGSRDSLLLSLAWTVGTLATKGRVNSKVKKPRREMGPRLFVLIILFSSSEFAFWEAVHTERHGAAASGT